MKPKQCRMPFGEGRYGLGHWFSNEMFSYPEGRKEEKCANCVNFSKSLKNNKLYFMNHWWPIHWWSMVELQMTKTLFTALLWFPKGFCDPSISDKITVFSAPCLAATCQVSPDHKFNPDQVTPSLDNGSKHTGGQKKNYQEKWKPWWLQTSRREYDLAR